MVDLVSNFQGQTKFLLEKNSVLTPQLSPYLSELFVSHPSQILMDTVSDHSQLLGPARVHLNNVKILYFELIILLVQIHTNFLFLNDKQRHKVKQQYVAAVQAGCFLLFFECFHKEVEHGMHGQQ